MFGGYGRPLTPEEHRRADAQARGFLDLYNAERRAMERAKAAEAYRNAIWQAGYEAGMQAAKQDQGR